jgi:hypothetical protein
VLGIEREWDRHVIFGKSADDTYVTDNVGEVVSLGHSSDDQVDLEISLARVTEGDLELVRVS